MTDRIITAQAIIKGKDETGPAFKSISEKVDQLAKKLGMAGKATALKNDLDQIEKKLGAIDKFRGAQDGLNRAIVKWREAKVAVDSVQRAIDAAGKPTKKLHQELAVAEGRLEKMTAAMERQRIVAQGTGNGLRDLGVSARRLGAEERGLVSAIEAANKALSRQSTLASRATPQRAAHSNGLSHLGRHVVGSALGVGAGYGALHVGEKVIENGAEYEKALNKVRNVSNSESEVELARQIAARAAAANPYTTNAQAVEDYVELRSLAVSNKHGESINREAIDRNVMLMSRARAALASSGYQLEGGEAKSLAQAIEGSGRTLDPRAQEKMLDAYVRAKQVFGNSIQASSVRDFVANAKASNFSASDESFFFTTMARLAQGNASRLGNEFNQTIQTIVGGHMTKAGAEWLAKVGVIDKSQIRKGGGGKFYINGQVKEQDLLSTDQTGWAQTVLMRGIEAAGALNPKAIEARANMLRTQELRANPNAQVDMHSLEERATHGLIADFVSKSGFRTTVTDNLVHAIANAYQTQKDVEQMKTATGMGAAGNIGRNPGAAFEELKNSILTSLTSVSSPATSMAGQVMHWMAANIAGNPNAAAYGIGVGGAFAAGAGGKLALDWMTAGSELKLAAHQHKGAAEALKLAAGNPAGVSNRGAALLPGGAGNPQAAQSLGWLGSAVQYGSTILSGVMADRHIAGLQDKIQGSPDWLDRRLGWGKGGFWGPGSTEDIGSWLGIVSKAHAETAPREIDITGKLEPVKLEGEANVRISVAVKGGEVTDRFVSSSGNIRASLGTSMPSIDSGHPPPT